MKKESETKAIPLTQETLNEIIKQHQPWSLEAEWFGIGITNKKQDLSESKKNKTYYEGNGLCFPGFISDNEILYKDFNFTGAKLINCTFYGCDIGSSFDKCDLSESKFLGTKLLRSSFQKANLTKATFKEVCLERANLSYADLSKAKLTGAILKKARREVTLLEEMFQYNFSDNYFEKPRTDFFADNPTTYIYGKFGANLTGANLDEAVLRYADLSGANLSGAILLNTTITLRQLARSRAVNDTFTVYGDILTLEQLGIWSEYIGDIKSTFFTITKEENTFTIEPCSRREFMGKVTANLEGTYKERITDAIQIYRPTPKELTANMPFFRRNTPTQERIFILDGYNIRVSPEKKEEPLTILGKISFKFK